MKAFDRVNHYYLISCMLKRGFPLQIVKVFLSWFCNMHASVKWKNVTSNCFKIKSGVPQGSLLGGKLYNLIVDEILQILEKNHLGCYVGDKFAGAIAYADDLILLSASVIKLQEMLRLCNECGLECDLKFNVQIGRAHV